MGINTKFANTILTLANSLTERNIPHTININLDGLQIRFPWNGGDLICHSGSYGHNEDMVESMGCPWDIDDVTSLSVEDALEKITNWYAEVRT